MENERATLTQFIAGVQRRSQNTESGLTAVLDDIALACKRVAALLRQGALGGVAVHTGAVDVPGEAQTRLGVAANEIFRRSNEWGGQVAGMVSEELEHPYLVPSGHPRGRYLLMFNPLEGATHIDANVAVGSIFSLLRCPDGIVEPTARDFLQPGADQVCAGYASYGPTTMLVLAMEQGVYGFTLDEQAGEFVLTHPQLRITEDTGELAIDVAHARFWEPAVKRYVDECLAGRSGPRDRDFNLRWIGSLVAEAHRILMGGGVYLSPRDARNPVQPGRPLHEANSVAFIVERAGGIATTGRTRILPTRPESLHQRIGLIFGSRREVELIERYHVESIEPRYDAPLFGLRGLFRVGEISDGESRP
jgi:fructose-1,6-bisphosphatase I/sedoheptulose-1,7-bisphosphatase